MMPGPGRKPKKKGRARKGTGSIYWSEKHQCYVGQISLGTDSNGKRIRPTFYGKTVEEVQRQIDEVKKDVLLGQYVPAQRITVEQHFKDWLRTKRPPNTSPTTFSKYRAVVENHIIPRLGRFPLRELDHLRLNAFYELLADQGLSQRYQFDVANVLKAGLADAVRKNLIPKNPAEIATAPKDDDKEARFLTEDEVQRFLLAAKGLWMEQFFVVLLHTGLRAGEALGLPWSAVDLDAATLTVRQGMVEVDGVPTITGVKTKTSRRTISLPAQAVAALRQQWRKQLEAKLAAGPQWSNPHDLVFSNRVGGFMTRSNIYRRDLRRALNGAAVLAAAKRYGCNPQETLALNAPHLPARPLRAGDGIMLPDGRQGEILPGDLMENVGLHTFRHTHAALLLSQGVQLYTVSRRLGHASISITADLYGHLMPGVDEAAASAMEAIGGRLAAEMS